MRFRFCSLSLVLLVAACGDDPELLGARDVTVTKVAIYQGVERVLAEGGASVASDVPIIRDRDALVRISYTAGPEQLGIDAVARLTFTDGEVFEVTQPLVEASTDGDLDSTMNIMIPGESIPETFDYSVSILQEGTEDNPDAHYPLDGSDVHAVEGSRNVLRITLVPYQYNADGSGRLPDTSPEAIATIRDRLFQLYPVSEVELTVREPVQWNQSIQPFGNGWQEVGNSIYSLRFQDGVADDVYYYAMFNPAASFAQFCAQGCVLGLTLLNDQPEPTGMSDLRFAMGVGFPEWVADTMAHEIGHSHGRLHAPCGQGLDPASIDNAFPHAQGGIGVRGWDIIGQSLIDPAATSDIMGYCENPWISDYNFTALHDRGINVNLPLLDGTAVDHDVVVIDAAGRAEWRELPPRLMLPADATSGHPIEVVDEAGHRHTVYGHYYRFDHVDGGWLFVPRGESATVHLETRLDGQLLSLDRAR